MRRAWLAAAFLLAAFAGGCFIVTGNSDGYTAAPRSSFVCTSSADCADAGGGLCCAGPGPTAQGGIPTVAFSCQQSCSGISLQICGGNSECGDGGACIPQSCRFTVSGVSSSVPFQSCTLIDCTKLGGS